MEFPPQSRLVICILDGLDNQPVGLIKNEKFEDLISKLSGKYPTQFLLISSGDEGHIKNAEQAIKTHVSNYSVISLENSFTFCGAITDMNYSGQCYQNLEGNIVLFITLQCLNEVDNDALLESMDKCLPTHIDSFNINQPLITSLFRPNPNSSFFLLTDNETKEILQWGNGNTGTIEVEEIKRARSKTFTIHQGTSFADAFFLNDNKAIGEILNDGTTAMMGFIKNLIDSGVLRPFPIHQYNINIPASTQASTKEVQLDPFYKFVDDEEAQDEKEEEDFVNEISAFVTEGLRDPENLKFKLMEIKTFRLSSNKTDNDVFNIALSTLFAQLSFPGSEIEKQQGGCEWSPSHFSQWFEEKQINLLWDMFFNSEDKDAQMIVLSNAFELCLAHLNAKASTPNIFGRFLKVLYDTVEEECEHAMNLSLIQEFVQTKKESGHLQLFESAEFESFLEWTLLDEESGYEEDDTEEES